MSRPPSRTSQGSWPRAAAAYHSQTPALGQAYQERVLAVWSEPDKPDTRGASPSHAEALGGEVAEKTEAHDAAKAAAMTGVMSGTPASTAALPPAGTFTRSIRLPAAPGAIARSLASYRAMPVQIAARAPAGVIARY